MPIWERKLIETERGTFEVFVSGEGPPLCVTHYYSAFTEKGNYFADMFTDRFRVHLVNLKDAGNSDKASTESELSMIETIYDLEDIRKHLNYDSWSFAGHSTGGMLGLVYGIHFGQSLDSLIIVGAAASKEYMISKDSIYCKDNPRNARLREVFSIFRNSTSRDEIVAAAREWTEMSLHHPERWDEYFSRPSSGKTVQSRLEYYTEQLSTYDLRKELHLIQVPTLVMCGRYDAQCPVEFSIEIHEGIPDSELHIFDDSNHSPHIEESNAFKEVISGFHYFSR